MAGDCPRRTAVALLAAALTTTLEAGVSTARSSPSAPEPVPAGEPPLSPGMWTRIEGRVESISPGGLVRLRTAGGTSAVVDVSTVASDAARLLYVGRDVAVFGLVRPDGVLTARGVTVDYESSPAASPRSR